MGGSDARPEKRKRDPFIEAKVRRHLDFRSCALHHAALTNIENIELINSTFRLTGCLASLSKSTPQTHKNNSPHQQN